MRGRFARYPAPFGLALLFALASACAGGPEGAEELRAALGERALPSIVVTGIGPENLATDDALARLQMPVYAGDREVVRFDACDIYFKAAFSVVDELRALGFDAAVDPQVWGARHEAVLLAAEALDEPTLLLHLTRLGAQEDVPALYQLKSEERRQLFAARRVLLAARSSLPARARLEATLPSGRDLRDRYFVLTSERRPLRLELSVLEALLRAEGVPAAPLPEAAAASGAVGDPATALAGEPPPPDEPEVGRQWAELALRFALTPGPRVDLSSRWREETEPSGVRRRGSGYEMLVRDDGPLERAFRAAVHDFVRALLPMLPLRSPQAAAVRPSEAGAARHARASTTLGADATVSAPPTGVRPSVRATEIVTTALERAWPCG